MTQIVGTLRPLGDRLVVESIEREETTASGIFLPETARGKSQAGIVLAIGPGRRNDDGQRIPIDVAVGDKVLFAKYAGTEVKFDVGYQAYKILIINEGDVLAVMDDSEAEA